MGNKFGVFLAGGLAGAAIALLYAPRSGKETRAIVTDKMTTAWGEAQELGTQAAGTAQQVCQDVASKGQQFAQATQAKGQELYGQASARVQEAAETLKPAFSQKNDELRGKIEAARRRIASQVAHNAAQSQSFVNETLSASADVADDVAQVAQEAAEGFVDHVADEGKPAAGTAAGA